MEYVHPSPEAKPSNNDIARTVALAYTALFLIERGFENTPTFQEDAGMGHYLYIQKGKSEWANGRAITDEDKNNYAAADTLMQLRGALLTETHGIKLPPAEEIFLQDNTWRKKVAGMLVKTALYTTDGYPSQALQLGIPYLEASIPRIRNPDDPYLDDENQFLPHSPDSRINYGKYQAVSDEFLQAMPTIAVEGIDEDDFWTEVEKFDPATDAPDTLAGNSWSVEGVIKDAPRAMYQVPWYENLDLPESTVYLTTLLEYIDDLNKRLHQIK